ncbi:(2Fe-2S)-binding protein [Paenibacillus polymyxa]|nr:(2Fe-2S)-binding protein [Paenibacillus polymyxa]MEE4562079.1 (2Fe-2S)-binding protein [Paenibacillus polymyxa]MEE4577576.1 (2Fe-2S)-binding protein [Paenibacillus polymyxa]UMR36784.1 (2Fe-2S)-binding protein [Paenibacillus polymyxa]
MRKRAMGRSDTVGTEVQGEKTHYAENQYAESPGVQSKTFGASGHVLVCRCEEVSIAQMEQACRMGVDTVRQLKMATRVTMGACQGRVCRQLVESWFYNQVPAARREAELLSQRPPVRPVTFGQLAEGGSL